MTYDSRVLEGGYTTIIGTKWYKKKQALRQRVEYGGINAIAVLQKGMHSLRMNLRTEGNYLKGSHSPTTEGDRRGARR